MLGIPILLVKPDESTLAPVKLPATADNLFQRIIRNPQPESKRARERECTEMLAAVLRNAPALRLHLLNWLAALSGRPVPGLADLRIEVETELSIETKRDDLRIEGFKQTGARDQPQLLWTIEAKVGAPLHTSGSLEFDETTDETSPTLTPITVSQIENYDGWLHCQPHAHRAGFILALRDMTDQLPPSCKCVWTCATWTDLGLEVERFLGEEGSSESHDRWIAAHLAGFIRTHLWRKAAMADSELDFNDLSLIRAFNLIGRTCEQRADALVRSLIPLVEEAGIGVGPVTHEQSLLHGQWPRSIICQNLVKGSTHGLPRLMVGINAGEWMSVYVQSSPKHPLKSEVVAAIQRIEPKLVKRDADWQVASVDDEELDWSVCERANALAFLLNEYDQQTALHQFVRRALEDLQKTGVGDAIRAVFKSPKRSASAANRK